MVNLLNYARKVAKQFSLVDRTIAKIDLIVIGLLFAKLFPILTSLHWGCYVAVLLLAEIYFIWRISQMKK